MSTYIVSWPPSTNGLWRAWKGRNILSRQARLWYESAKKELLAQKAKPVLGPVNIVIDLRSPHKRPYDPDNRVKCIMDLLVKSGVLEGDNDSIVQTHTVNTRPGGDFEGARISISKVKT